MTQRKPRPTAAQNYRTQIYKLQERVRRAFDRGEIKLSEDQGQFLLEFLEFHQIIGTTLHQLKITKELLQRTRTKSTTTDLSTETQALTN
jgi:uncharacterized protein YfbU (UPF0304 family)